MNTIDKTRKISQLPDVFTSKENPMCFSLTDHGDAGAHNHQFVEIVYIVSGTIEHQLSDGTTQTITEGDMFLILPPNWHRYTRKNEEYCAHRDIIINTDFFKQACDYLSPDLFNRFLNGQISSHTKISTGKTHRLESQISNILQRVSLLGEDKLMLLRAFLVQLLQCFIISDSDERVNRVPAWFRDLLANFDKIEYLQSGLAKITEEFAYDRKYLCHAFKKYMGITMTEHLNNCRLTHAVHMLQNTDRSILDISATLGFSSVAYFSTVFKEKYGCPPSFIRRQTVAIE